MSVLMVSSGALVVKLANFSLNASFAHHMDDPRIVAAAKAIATASAWAGLVHFSSSRYIARLSCSGDILRALVSLRIALSLIGVTMIGLTGFFIFHRPSQELSTAMIFISAVAIPAFALLDLSISLSNASGHNRDAAIAQGAFGATLAFGAAMIAWTGPTQTFAAMFIIVSSAFLTGTVLTRRIQSSLQAQSRGAPMPQPILWEFLSQIQFALPGMLSAFTVMPLVLWTIQNRFGITGADFVLFLIFQNLLGLTMLFPGQVNTAVFSLLARNANSRTVAGMTFSMALGSSLLSSAAVFFAIPYLGPIYGNAASALKDNAIWFIASAVPFSLHQFIASRFFIAGRPWLEAGANLVFGIVFFMGSTLKASYSDPLHIASLLLFLCYWLRLAAMVLLSLVARNRSCR